MKLIRQAALCSIVFVAACATSAQEQRRAEQHQFKADEAADQGRYQVADQEQRNAADAHHQAVTKAIDEGQPIPPQLVKGGGTNPDGGH